LLQLCQSTGLVSEMCYNEPHKLNCTYQTKASKLSFGTRTELY